MSYVARLILVSKEFTSTAEVEAMRARMPSQEDFHWMVTWDYETDLPLEKAANFENTMLSLQDTIQFGDVGRPGEGRWVGWNE